MKVCLSNNWFTEHNVNVDFLYKFYFSAWTLKLVKFLSTLPCKRGWDSLFILDADIDVDHVDTYMWL